jgi:hypothetical protein
VLSHNFKIAKKYSFFEDINMKHFKNLPNVNVTGSSPSTSASWSGSDNVFSGEAFGASKVGLILFDSGDADGFLKDFNF